MPSVRTGTPMECIFSARSRIPVSEMTSFSKRAGSIQAAIRHSIFSAPAGPSVVMMCITLIMFVFILLSETSSLVASESLFGWNHRPAEQAPHIPELRLGKQILVNILVSADHVCHFIVLSCAACGGRSHRLPRRLILEERVHRLGEPEKIAGRDQESLLPRFKKIRHAACRGADDGQAGCHGLKDRERVALIV